LLASPIERPTLITTAASLATHKRFGNSRTEVLTMSGGACFCYSPGRNFFVQFFVLNFIFGNFIGLKFGLKNIYFPAIAKALNLVRNFNDPQKLLYETFKTFI
jgi:hypothetical protein